MKKASITFLRVVIVLAGLLALTLLIIEPRFEGVNAHATTLREIYFDDPFLMIVYAGSIPFFIGLYQVVKILGYVAENNIFSQAALKAVRAVRHCAFTVIGFVAVEEFIIMLTHGDDDAAGGFMMGVFITLGSAIVATTAIVCERILRNAVEIKSENDLTI